MTYVYYIIRVNHLIFFSPNIELQNLTAASNQETLVDFPSFLSTSFQINTKSIKVHKMVDISIKTGTKKKTEYPTLRRN